MFGCPVTPFRSDLSLDLDALERNVDNMAGHRFCAIIAAGGTGALYSISVEEIEQQDELSRAVYPIWRYARCTNSPACLPFRRTPPSDFVPGSMRNLRKRQGLSGKLKGSQKAS